MSRLRTCLTVVQAICAVRVAGRLARTRHGVRIPRSCQSQLSGQRISVLVPVLNEAERIERCLAALSAQSGAVAEILVIDGGSSDRTQEIVARHTERDRRIRLVDASPVPARVNGKAHGLQTGLQASDPASEWILTVDADVQASPDLAESLIAFARSSGVRAFSIATQQQVPDAAAGLLHPALLATLVYRFGIPGQATTDPRAVQANGQCQFVSRPLLDEIGGFGEVLGSINEDVTLARLLALRGCPVGFYESDDLVRVEMYRDWRETWRNWPRSLPMRDRLVDRAAFVGLAELIAVQALPLPVVLLEWARGRGRSPLGRLNLGLLAMRLGLLFGMRRAYERPPSSYWLSPCLDLPVVAKLWSSALRRNHAWRGRAIVRG